MLPYNITLNGKTVLVLEKMPTAKKVYSNVCLKKV